MTPKENPAMTEFSIDTAARSSLPSCPAKTWVIAPREYWHMVVKMAGPARYHSFLDSPQNSLKKSGTLLIGGISSASAVKEEAKEVFFVSLGSNWSWSWLSSSLSWARSGFLLSSMRERGWLFCFGRIELVN